MRCDAVLTMLWMFVDVHSSGGVLLKAAAGRITCDNTLDARLRIACDQTQPEIRTTLFGASATRKHKD